jgi:hypothetical protein
VSTFNTRRPKRYVSKVNRSEGQLRRRAAERETALRFEEMLKRNAGAK